MGNITDKELENDVKNITQLFADFSDKHRGNKGISAITLFNLNGDWRMSISVTGEYVRELAKK